MKYIKVLFVLPFILCICFLNFNYFNCLNLLPIIPPNYIIVTILCITYLLKFITICKIYNNFDIKTTKEFNKYLYTNLLFNFISIISLCVINNLFLTFSSITICSISNLFLYYETKSYSNKISKYLVPSILFSIFCCINVLIIYFMNL